MKFVKFICVFALAAVCLLSASAIAADGCLDGRYTDDDDNCFDCKAGYFCDGVGYYICPKASYGVGIAVRTDCTLCGKGTTTDDAGASADTACTACGNDDNAKAWAAPTWNAAGSNSYVSNICRISSCADAYKIDEDKDNNECIKCALADGAGACKCSADKYPKEGNCVDSSETCDSSYPKGAKNVCTGDNTCKRDCNEGDVLNSAPAPDATFSGYVYQNASTDKSECKTSKCKIGYRLEVAEGETTGLCKSCSADAGKYCDGGATTVACMPGYYCPGGNPGTVCTYGNGGYNGLCKCRGGLTSEGSSSLATECIIAGMKKSGGASRDCGNNKCTKFCDTRGCFYLPKDVPYY